MDDHLRPADSDGVRTPGPSCPGQNVNANAGECLDAEAPALVGGMEYPGRRVHQVGPANDRWTVGGTMGDADNSRWNRVADRGPDAERRAALGLQAGRPKIREGKGMDPVPTFRDLSAWRKSLEDLATDTRRVVTVESRATAAHLNMSSVPHTLDP